VHREASEVYKLSLLKEKEIHLMKIKGKLNENALGVRWLCLAIFNI
jgi:hypothetical protein